MQAACLECTQIFSNLLALGQHTGSPYMCGTRCWALDIAAELLNVPHAHVATCLAPAVPIYRPYSPGGQECVVTADYDV